MKARSRILRPSFFTNEDLAELPFETRLLFEGLWTLADKEGRLENRPKRIKIHVFPYDDVDIVEGLLGLEKYGFIVTYAWDGKKYIQINNFLKHQRPHHKEEQSVIPAPEGHAQAQGKHESSKKHERSKHLTRTSTKTKTGTGTKTGTRTKGKHTAESIEQEIPYEKIITDLNNILGTRYKHKSPLTRANIHARFSEGFKVEDFYHVHRVKVLNWLGDPKMERYLRPKTLYCKKNFESYVNEKIPNQATSDTMRHNMATMSQWLRHTGQTRENDEE